MFTLRSCIVIVLAATLAMVALAPAPALFAAPASPDALVDSASATITFEESIPQPGAILSQYCNNATTNKGVEFVETVRIIEPGVQTASPSHAATNQFPGQEFAELDKLQIHFTTGQSQVSVSTLTGGTYQGNGTWTNTYFTK